VAGQIRVRLAGYKVPKDVVVVPSLERGPNGKLDYRRVRELAARGAALTPSVGVGDTA
jgi:acyl-CoA synthetase (AMP-forming)/AMP-acid ligase II